MIIKKGYSIVNKITSNRLYLENDTNLEIGDTVVPTNNHTYIVVSVVNDTLAIVKPKEK